MAISHLEELSIRELIAFIFLLEEGKSSDELKTVISNPEFLKRWKEAENRFRALVKYYPDEDEEKFYLIATLDAVHDIDPFSDKALDLKRKYMPFIKSLVQ